MKVVDEASELRAHAARTQDALVDDDGVGAISFEEPLRMGTHKILDRNPKDEIFKAVAMVFRGWPKVETLLCEVEGVLCEAGEEEEDGVWKEEEDKVADGGSIVAKLASMVSTAMVVQVAARLDEALCHDDGMEEAGDDSGEWIHEECREIGFVWEMDAGKCFRGGGGCVE